MSDFSNAVRAFKEMFSDYVEDICRELSVPDKKLVADLLFGVLKGGNVLVSDIARALNEGNTLDSTEVRLTNAMKRFYKHALDFDDTREHTDCSVYASELVDFLSETLTYRMINRFKEKGLLETQTYSKMLKTLKRAKKVRIGDEWKLVRINPAEEERLKKLGLLPGDGPQPKRKRGRPRKQAL